MLNSVEQVIDAIGGNSAAAKLAGVTEPAVSNWKFRKRIPSKLFPAFSKILTRERLRADPSVFGVRSFNEEVA